MHRPVNSSFPLRRLVAEKINKNERKDKAEIITDIDCCKTSEFWTLLGEEDELKPQQPFKVFEIDALELIRALVKDH